MTILFKKISVLIIVISKNNNLKNAKIAGSRAPDGTGRILENVLLGKWQHCTPYLHTHGLVSQLIITRQLSNFIGIAGLVSTKMLYLFLLVI